MFFKQINISRPLPVLLFGLLLFLSAFPVMALDDPHGLYGDVSSASCHQTGDAAWWSDQESNVFGKSKPTGRNPAFSSNAPRAIILMNSGRTEDGVPRQALRSIKRGKA